MKKYVTLAALVLFLSVTVYAAVYAAARQPGRVTGAVNINTATKEELLKLPYVTNEIATNIIDARDINGPYQSPDDLLKVKGVTPGLLSAIEPYVEVQGKTNIHEDVGHHG
jgi:DNA uptake protein ComE-like DNA-binding protein